MQTSTPVRSGWPADCLLMCGLAYSVVVQGTGTLPVVQALYPSPASDRLHVELSAPASAQVVALRLTELLSGKVVLQTELPVTKADYRSADIDVRKLPIGQYAALLTVDGVPATTQKVLISR